jgi:hypothetical protein
MRGWLGVILIYAAVVSAPGQTPSSKFQPGTITAVMARQSPGQHETDVTQYIWFCIRRPIVPML